ncbi:MAG: hypothetical protein COB88_02545 [Flavobacteriales bacterium]|nr:MAG: hypothetical protein COB88_02545 [Flavobacteriales bacterium]
MKSTIPTDIVKMLGVILIGTAVTVNSALANSDTLKSVDQPHPKNLANGMNNEILEKILQDNGKILEGSLGFWQVQYLDRVLTVVTDESHNRMRIMTAVVHKKDLKKAQTTELLEAQFDRALDVKYALYNDILWSAFVHPLKELTEHQVKDALSQVYYAAHNFGGSYRSTDLQFGNRED